MKFEMDFTRHRAGPYTPANERANQTLSKPSACSMRILRQICNTHFKSRLSSCQTPAPLGQRGCQATTGTCSIRAANALCTRIKLSRGLVLLQEPSAQLLLISFNSRKEHGSFWEDSQSQLCRGPGQARIHVSLMLAVRTASADCLEQEHESIGYSPNNMSAVFPMQEWAASCTA